MFGGKGSGEETTDSNGSMDETINSGNGKTESCQFLVNKFKKKLCLVRFKRELISYFRFS